MHMSINCHLLTPQWTAHKVNAAREPIGITEKRLQLTSFLRNASSI